MLRTAVLVASLASAAAFAPSAVLPRSVSRGKFQRQSITDLFQTNCRLVCDRVNPECNSKMRVIRNSLRAMKFAQSMFLYEFGVPS